MKQLFPLAAAGLVLAACGGVPGNSIATVDGDPVEKADYEHWMTVATKASPGVKRKDLKAQVINLVLSFRWIDGEASAVGVAVTDAEVKKSFTEQKRQSFPKDTDYEAFLMKTTQTEADILRRVRLELLSNKIRDKVLKGSDKVTDQAISTFYAKNKTRFAQPEKRDLRTVLTKTEREADKARAGLDDGDGWTTVAKRYSIDDTSKAVGGKLPAQAKGTLDQDLDDAVFSAEEGELVGPVKTQYGYYVFTVTDVVAPTQQTLAEAKPAIQQTLAAEGQQKAFSAWLEDFNQRWRAQTQCAPDYRTSDCANGPKPTPTPTAG